MSVKPGHTTKPKKDAPRTKTWVGNSLPSNCNGSAARSLVGAGQSPARGRGTESPDDRRAKRGASARRPVPLCVDAQEGQGGIREIQELRLAENDGSGRCSGPAFPRAFQSEDPGIVPGFFPSGQGLAGAWPEGKPALPLLQSGFALLTVIVAIAVLSMVAIEFHYRSLVELRVAKREAELAQARFAASSGVALARRLLAEDSPSRDDLGESWALPLELQWEGISWSVQIADGDGKLGLGGLFDLTSEETARREQELRRLARLVSGNEVFAAALLDWLDEDSFPRAGGAEDAYYLARGYRCKNGPLDVGPELYLVRHARPGGGAEGPAWDEYLSPRPAGEVNVNTASVEVLASLAEDLDLQVARAVAVRRRSRPFNRIVELKEVPGVTQEIYNEIFDRVKVASKRFRIESRARVAGSEMLVIAEVERSGGETSLLSWSAR